jgi:hypothetical protein
LSIVFQIIQVASKQYPLPQAIYQHLDLQQNVFAVSLALQDLNQEPVQEKNLAQAKSGSDDARDASAR